MHIAWIPVTANGVRIGEATIGEDGLITMNLRNSNEYGREIAEFIQRGDSTMGFSISPVIVPYQRGPERDLRDEVRDALRRHNRGSKFTSS